MRYGMPYKGSKNAIAKWVVDNLPPSHTLVDIMAGGCAITHCALLSGKYEKVIANDISGTTDLFQQAINGEFQGYSTVPTREEFNENKHDDIAMSLIYSFGNNREDYLWGKDIEEVKILASKMVSMTSIYERKRAYKKFIQVLVKYFQEHRNIDTKLELLQGLEGLERLERLQGLERLERLQGLECLETLNVDYKDVVIPKGATVYCDPPYRNTDCKSYRGFDTDAFDEWLATVDFMVIVSEYTQPKGCVEVSSTEKYVLSDVGGKEKMAQEKLFVQERFVEDYKARMKKGTLFELLD